ncbi:DUF485 domain-containing protein [Neobacillus cucumis]|uniref:DUF485 domain-containing protein n=1 Tax=Neobacillus cucumis TaxID=1740721 RepID=UPI0018DFB50C|nr:DUF485 domain-containing protein [Neobacillus cucumis]MBI0579555.1 DUF485 domain-containing protein [Neobacillus cucumis]WHY94814.1 DUF485 domain-containing protein [Neobacillus cucumis]
MQQKIQELPVQKNISYEGLIQTKEFKELVQRKKTFILPTTIFFLIFYFTLPLLAAYTKVLHTEIVGPITGAWIFAGLQFLLVWVCGFIYVKKSEKYDNLAKAILHKYRGELSG